MEKNYIKKYSRIILIIFLIFFYFYKEREINSPALAGDKNINTMQDRKKISHYNKDVGFVNQVKGLNIRVEASRESAILTLLPLFTMVSILDDNGPLDKIISKSGKEISGKWLKIKVKNSTGWVFGPYLTILKNAQNKRVKPNFNKMKLKLKSRAICCDCGPYTNDEEMIFSNGMVSYSRIHGWEESEKIIQEGKYSINNNIITIRLKEGTIFDNFGDGSQYKLSNKKASERTVTLEWHEELKGFITTDMIKYLKDDKYVVNMIDGQFVSIPELIDNDLCIKNLDYQDYQDYCEYLLKNKMNNAEMLNGFYYENNK